MSVSVQGLCSYGSESHRRLSERCGAAPSFPSWQVISGKGSSSAGPVCAIIIMTAAWLRGEGHWPDLDQQPFVNSVVLG